MREMVEVAEMIRRMAEHRPRVLIVEGMPNGRIVHERATEATFGPVMRRLSLYAMSPHTHNRATCEVRAKWGVWPDIDEHHAGEVVGRSLRIPLRFPDGVREWEVQL